MNGGKYAAASLKCSVVTKRGLRSLGGSVAYLWLQSAEIRDGVNKL